MHISNMGFQIQHAAKTRVICASEIQCKTNQQQNIFVTTSLDQVSF